MTINQAVVLAAGEGSRMRPLTYTRPKAMLPLANQPILEHLLIALRQSGISDVAIIVGYHDEQIRNYCGDGSRWNLHISYYQQTQQLGTADALRMVAGLLKDDFIMANGDALLSSRDIRRLCEKSGNIMSVRELDDVSQFGVVEVRGDRVCRIHEKSQNPPSHLANAGLYRFTPEIFSAIARTEKSPRGEYELTDSIQALIDSNQPVNYQILEQWLDFSYPWDLLAANEKILGSLEPHNLGQIEPNVTIKGNISIGRGTLIRSGAYIVGPVIIGDNCDIGPNCYLRPATSIGNNCHIGAFVELKNSIVMSGTKVPHLNYVGDSILGENCNLGAGTKIANLKLNKKNIHINQRDTGRRKLGAIIGDKVETGINASINVGSLIGNNTFIGPGALASGNIAPGSKIF